MQKTSLYWPSLILFGFLLSLVSCDSPVSFPRKWGFPRIEVPAKAERSYQRFDNQSCPFNFEYPQSAVVSRDRNDSCWVDISFPAYHSKWHISYRNSDITGKSRDFHFEEWRRLIYSHSKKASQIKGTQIGFDNGYGSLYEIYGNVGTPAQIFYSDSSGTQMMMISCYFQTALKNDSLAPAIAYMKEELQYMAQSLTWKGY